MSTGKSTLTNKSEEISVKDEFNLHIPASIWASVNYLHDKYGDIEWSGPIFYEVEGDIEDPENFKCTIIDFQLMDVGTGAYTEYDNDETVMDKFMELRAKYPEKVIKMGHMHTHHSMNTYFSGTDMDELHSNAPHHNYYLSVIVNKNGDCVAKIAISSIKESTKVSFKFEGGVSKYFETVETPVLTLIDAKIDVEEPTFDNVSVKYNRNFTLSFQKENFDSLVESLILPDLKGRIEKLEEESKKKKAKTVTYGNSINSYTMLGGQLEFDAIGNILDNDDISTNYNTRSIDNDASVTAFLISLFNEVLNDEFTSMVAIRSELFGWDAASTEGVAYMAGGMFEDVADNYFCTTSTYLDEEEVTNLLTKSVLIMRRFGIKSSFIHVFEKTVKDDLKLV